MLTDWEGRIIESIDFSSSIVGECLSGRGGVEIWGEGDSIEDAIEDLRSDGYTAAQVKKMKLRVEKVATF